MNNYVIYIDGDDGEDLVDYFRSYRIYINQYWLRNVISLGANVEFGMRFMRPIAPVETRLGSLELHTLRISHMDIFVFFKMCGQTTSF